MTALAFDVGFTLNIRRSFDSSARPFRADHMARDRCGSRSFVVHAALTSYYPRIGRPSIDPVLMIRMLIVGYVFQSFGASTVP